MKALQPPAVILRIVSRWLEKACVPPMEVESKRRQTLNPWFEAGSLTLYLYFVTVFSAQRRWDFVALFVPLVLLNVVTLYRSVRESRALGKSG